MKENTVKELYESCRNDRGGITDIICLTKFGKGCTSYLDFIHAIGDNGVTTFDIQFKFEVEDPFVLDDPKLLSCNEEFNGMS